MHSTATCTARDLGEGEWLTSLAGANGAPLMGVAVACEVVLACCDAVSELPGPGDPCPEDRRRAEPMEEADIVRSFPGGLTGEISLSPSRCCRTGVALGWGMLAFGSSGAGTIAVGVSG
jgi:hypothetical protein